MTQKATLRARVKKLAANSGEKMDSIQLQLDENQMADHGDALLELRRFDNVKIKIEQQQASMDMQTGEVRFLTIEFQAMNFSLSCCFTETGIIATLTISTEQRDAFDKIIQHHLREQIVDVEFEEGANPFAAH